MSALDRTVLLPLVALLSAACLHAEPRPADEEDESTSGAEGDPGEPEPLPPVPIVGGHQVQECEWPNTVALLSPSTLCTGTLLDPSLVVYAAHCGDDFVSVRFGEAIDGEGLARVVPVEECEAMEGGVPGSGRDIAWCRLAQPVADVPIVPPLMGCELGHLMSEHPVTMVGFGRTADGGQGVKHAVEATLHGLSESGELHLGGDGADTCQGDSGGPAFVRVADGSWRVAGVTSWGGRCGEGGYATLLPSVVDWIEQRSGVDISPCHDADGTWAPGPRCGGFAAHPEQSGGQWAQGCSASVTGPGATCGSPYTPPSDHGCAGFCGTQAPEGCWCDDACTQWGDCCVDRSAVCPATTPRCVGACGDQAPSGCWCDAACVQHSDCCPDVSDTCG